MSHAVAEITQTGDKHNARAVEIGQSLSHYTELAGLLEKYGQAEKVRFDSERVPLWKKARSAKFAWRQTLKLTLP